MYDVNTIEANLGRPLTVAERAQVELWITWTEAAIRKRMGDLDQLDQDALSMVVTEVVTQRVRTPEPLTQLSISVDDGNVNKTFQKSAGRIFIPDDLWDALGWSEDSGAFSAFMEGEPDFYTPLRREWTRAW